MKILAIICEFNPFHNGHLHLIERAKNTEGFDGVLCIMSGDFTQRGEICLFDKYTRAKHAVKGGADCVIQLPAPFAVAPAEVFAKGAIKILSSIPDVSALAFGCENGNKEDFMRAASLLIDENDEFKNVLGENLSAGESYIKSYAAAFGACGGDNTLIENPNNILGLEYTKAILRAKADIEIIPVKRIGSDYNDIELKENYSSAGAIRKNLNDPKVKGNVPEFVYNDLKNALDVREADAAMGLSLFNSDTSALSKIYGCGEGLENKLKSLENERIDSLIEKATSKRYPSARIRRILCANMLGLYGEDSERFLKAELYIKPLAVKKERADELLSALAKSDYPVVCGITDAALSETAKECFNKDRYEFAIYRHISRTVTKDYMVLI